MTYEKTCASPCRWARSIAIIILGVALLPFFCEGVKYGVNLVSGVSDRPTTRPHMRMRGNLERNRGQHKHRQDKKRFEEVTIF